MTYFFFRRSVCFVSASCPLCFISACFNCLFNFNFWESRCVYLYQLNWRNNGLNSSGSSSCITCSLGLTSKLAIFPGTSKLAIFPGLGCRFFRFLQLSCSSFFLSLLLLGLSDFSLSCFLLLHFLHLLFQPSCLILIYCSVKLYRFF